MRQATGSEVFVAELPGIVPHYERRTYDPEKQQTKDVPISDFVFTPVATITVDEDQPRTIFVVEVLGRQFQLPSDYLDTSAKFEHWCGTVNLGWSGTLHDLRGVKYLLRTAGVPEWDGTTVVGLHDGVWVTPHETFGGNGPVYVAHEFGDWNYATRLQPYESIVNLNGEVDPSWLDAINSLVSMHVPSVMTPLLGWFAAAPLRSLLNKFPVLNVSGMSGRGKTTIVETLCEAFGFSISQPIGLTSATPFGVVAESTKTNAFPVWFDEYRASIRSDTMQKIENVILDAWDCKAIPTGGTNSNNAMIVRRFPIRAPLIVSGEQSFTEKAHLDRMVTVEIPEKGRSVEELNYLRTDGLFNLNGFGRKYLEWLVADVDNDVKQPPVDLDRQDHCQAVVRWGYTMLARFLDTHCYNGAAEEALPIFKYSRVEQQRKQAVNPYDALIIEAIDGEVTEEVSEEVIGGVEYILVRPTALMAWNRRSRSEIKLPSEVAHDFTSHLKTQYGAVRDTNRGGAWRFKAKYFDAMLEKLDAADQEDAQDE